MRTAALVIALLLIHASNALASSASRHAKVATIGCDTELNTATFRGAMTRFGKATTLQQRFTLQERVKGSGGFHRVPLDGFDTWFTSAPGKKGYVYDKTVTELENATTYRVIVRFRWRNAKNQVVASALKVTPVCRQPDDRPDLRVKAINARPNGYAVVVVNRGAHEAGPFTTRLSIGDAPALADQGSTAPLAPGASTTFLFSAARCTAGSTLTATVDTTAAVDESDETDNVLAVPCNARRASLD